MGKSQLIHNNEFHLISKAEIRKATGKLVESLNLAAGSTDGFDIYKVVDAYFTDLDKRHEVNALLGIGESCQYYGEPSAFRRRLSRPGRSIISRLAPARRVLEPMTSVRNSVLRTACRASASPMRIS